jgi:hypothetical protein
MVQKCLRFLAAAIALLAIGAMPAAANVITQANASVTCTGYTFNVAGTDLSANVQYYVTFTITGVNGSASGRISVSSTDASGDFTGSWTGTYGPLNGSFTPGGITDLYSVNADGTSTMESEIFITFTPTSLTCGGSTTPPPSVCSTGPQSLVYNVSEGSKNASEIVWFNSHFKLQGSVPSTDFTVSATNQSITFGPTTLAVPNAVITFTDTVNCASTSFNASANEWDTTVPLSYATHADEIFSAGLAYELPPSFPQNVNNVSWNVTFTSSAPSLQFQFQYGAANYLSSDSKGDVFPMASGSPDYNAMMIDPVHNGPTCNNYNAGDHAGTPESAEVKQLVTGGGSGGGGSNWTGSWSSTPTYVCAAPQ